MQKKLLAVAVAGVLAAPAVALAQSSVTISGNFKVSMENVSISSFNNQTPNSRPAGAKKSETRLADDSSRIIFNVVEDLGGGLAAIGQLDIRFKFDDAGTSAVTNVGGQIGAGNTHVGLRSKSWGSLIFGRQDLHYYNTESDITSKAVSLRQDPISLIAYAGGGGTAIATASRTQNVTRWLSPNWGGFTMIVAYSTNGAGNDNDINSPLRRGSAWNLNPNFQAANFQVGYSYWNQKSDAVAAPVAGVAPQSVAFLGTGAFQINPGGSAAFGYAAQNQRGDRLYGSFKFGGFKVGLAWDKSKITAVTAATSLETSNRTAWSIPVGWTGGNHNVYAHYTKARSDKSSGAGTVGATAVAGVCGGVLGGSCSTGAKMWAVGYAYDMSKRTSVGISYSKINNDNGAVYNHFTSTSLGDQGSAILPGEDPRILAATIRHAF